MQNKIAAAGLIFFLLIGTMLPYHQSFAVSPALHQIAGLNFGGSDSNTVSASGHFVYVGDQSGGVHVVDVTNPASPQVLGQISFPVNITSVFASGNYVYVGTSNNASGNEFSIIDVSNPNTPVLKGGLDFGPSISVGGSDAIFILGNHAFVGVNDDNGPGNEFKIIDVTDPTAPAEISGISTASRVDSVNVVGNYAYIGKYSGGDGRVFEIIDISNILSPQVLGGQGFGKILAGFAVKVSGHYAYVGNYDPNGINDFMIIDVADPVNTQVVYSTATGARVLSLDVAGNYVFLGTDSQTGNRLRVFDVSTPTNPAEITGLPDSNVSGIAVSGSTAYLAVWGNPNGNFQAIDINGLTQPDTTLPTAVMNTLANGTVSGTVSISATASDDIRVANVQFQLSGQNLGAPVTTSDITSPFVYNWNTTQTSDGTYALNAVATDTSGNQTISTPISVTVDNTHDSIPPQTSITYPANNASVGHTIFVYADATDNFAVSNVQFQIDGTNIGVPQAAVPYRVSLDTTTIGNGSHTLTTLATDSSNNQTTSAPIVIQINNGPLWYSSFVASRQFYVSPTGTGSGTSVAMPMSLSAAMNNATAGDEYWLMAGSYPGNSIFNNSGTLAHPILWRAMDKAEASFIDVVAKGGYNWFWDLEVTDPTNTDTSGAAGSMSAMAPGTHFINNIIHDTWNCGIGGWDTGPNQVYYGNVIYKVGQNANPNSRCYSIYTQNRYSTNGYKYIIENMFLDTATDVGGPGYNFHGYTEEGYISGFDVEKNVSSNGRFLIGGFNEPASNEIVKNNYYYKSSPEFGYRRPTQVDFENNYLGKSMLQSDWIWGQNSASPLFVKPAPNIYAGNTINPDNGNLFVEMDTSAYTPARTQDVPPLDSGDVFDNNTYLSNTNNNWRLVANNVTNCCLANLPAWQSATGAAGSGFDTHSVTGPAPTAMKIFVDANEYQSGRGNIVVYNWAGNTSASVDLSSLGFQNGDSYKIYKAKDLFGAPVASGIYRSTNISIPLTDEFSTFVVVKDVATDTQAPSVSVTAPQSGASVSGLVNITATASDNVGVTSVQLQLDGSNLGSPITQAPYTFSWDSTTVSVGTHTVSAIAKDAANNSTVSAPITVHVLDALPPTIAITNPANGSNVSGTVSITASASDNVGVKSVQFILDGTNLGNADTQAPYAISWNSNSVGQGQHTITAKAVDAANNSKISAPVVVNIPDTIAPTVSVTSPANNAKVSGTVNIVATASDNVGVKSVQFILDGANIGSPDTQAPYGLSWDTSTASVGSHKITAKAIDAANNSKTSSQISVTVLDVSPPVISNLGVANVKNNTATINWTTNEPANSEVYFGLSATNLNNSTIDSKLVTAHSVILKNLKSNTTYYYQVYSKDAAANQATSAVLSFKTLK